MEDQQLGNLRCEYLVNPVGIDVVSPRLSWQLLSDQPGVRQAAYQVQVASTRDDLANGTHLIWDSGCISSDQCTQVAYLGPELQPQQRLYWTVKVWDQDGTVYVPLETAFWQMGLGIAHRWQARWIGFDTCVDASVRPEGPAGSVTEVFGDGDEVLNMRPPVYFQHTFTVDQPIVMAWLYIAARGLYDAQFNDQDVTDQVLMPGWTDYQNVIEYQTHDVHTLLMLGENTIGVVLADGWYSGYLGPQGQRGTYGENASLLAELHLTLADGSQRVIATGEDWQASEGPLRYAELYHGEYEDRSLDFNWQHVKLAEPPGAMLVGQAVEPQRVTLQLTPVSIRSREPGVYLVDMGQNMVGWVRMKANGPAGTRIQLRHSESLLPDGEVDTINLGPARAIDTVILSGSGDEVYEPRFTYHGFRYVEVLGYPGELTPAHVTGCVVHADLLITGHVETSSDIVNRLFENTLWSQRGNYNTIPTDCPQRAERLGWTGDVFSFARTGAYNMDCAAYYARWMDILLREQSEDGGFPNVAPRVVLTLNGAPAWADAAIFLPYLMLEQYGDLRLAERAYPALVRYMDHLESLNLNHLWLEGRMLDFGDWLSFNDVTPTDLLATAVWAMDARWMKQIAKALGLTQDVHRWDELHAAISAAFQTTFVSHDGRLKGDSQGAYVIAVSAAVLSPTQAIAAIDRLVSLVESRDWHLSTGFVTTPLLLPVLSQYGYDEVAYRLLLQETVPSWGYIIRQGATTIWERWDGDIEMRRIHGSETSPRVFVHPVIGELAGMNSYNHYAYGAVVEWMYAYLLGIRPVEGGFRHILIEPHIASGLEYAQGHYDSLHGRIKVAWRRADAQLHFTITIPPNTLATIRLPSVDASADAARIGFAIADGAFVQLERTSGTYEFSTWCNDPQVL